MTSDIDTDSYIMMLRKKNRKQVLPNDIKNPIVIALLMTFSL